MVIYNQKQEGGRRMRNEETRNTINKEEEEVMRKVEFTVEEKLRDLSVINLGLHGSFHAYYILPETREIFGEWLLSEEALYRLNEQGVEIENPEKPQWASIYYRPARSSLERERELLDDQSAEAHEFLELKWDMYEVDIEEPTEEDEERKHQVDTEVLHAILHGENESC